MAGPEAMDRDIKGHKFGNRAILCNDPTRHLFVGRLAHLLVPNTLECQNRGANGGRICDNQSRSNSTTGPVATYVHRKTSVYLVAKALGDTPRKAPSDQNSFRIDGANNRQQGKIEKIRDRINPVVDDDFALLCQMLQVIN
jgi:hypothetical protein